MLVGPVGLALPVVVGLGCLAEAAGLAMRVDPEGLVLPVGGCPAGLAMLVGPAGLPVAVGLEAAGLAMLVGPVGLDLPVAVCLGCLAEPAGIAMLVGLAEGVVAAGLAVPAEAAGSLVPAMLACLAGFAQSVAGPARVAAKAAPPAVVGVAESSVSVVG